MHERVYRSDGSPREVLTSWFTFKLLKEPVRFVHELGRHAFNKSFTYVGDACKEINVRAASFFDARDEAMISTGLERHELELSTS